MGNNSNSGGSTMLIVLVVAVCCCCVSSMVPVGFYFFYAPFKNWVNNLFGIGNNGDTWSCTLTKKGGSPGTVNASNQGDASRACYQTYPACASNPGGCYVTDTTAADASSSGNGSNFICAVNDSRILYNKNQGTVTKNLQKDGNMYPTNLQDAQWACNNWVPGCITQPGGCYADKKS